MMSVWADPVGLPIGEAGAVVTVGTFDGVHRGHHDVLTRLAALAAATGRPSVVVTFEPHPLEVIRPSAAPPLLTLHNEKLEMFALCGVSYVAVLPFTPTLASYEAEQFVDAVLIERFRVAELLVGHDHGFGRGRLGDISVLKALGASNGSVSRCCHQCTPPTVRPSRRPRSDPRSSEGICQLRPPDSADRIVLPAPSFGVTNAGD